MAETASATFGQPDASPLAGLSVVDLSLTLPGPYCSQILSRLGASVVHIQPPTGDPLAVAAVSSYATLAAGKQVVRLNLKTPSGRNRALGFLEHADIVVEGWRPGVAERLGVAYSDVAARNPNVVYCSISGYGQSSPLAMRPGHDINYLAEAGALDLCAANGIPVGDFAGSMNAALRIVSAVRSRENGGRGGHLDVSITGALIDWVDALGGADSADFLDVYDLPHYGSFALADGMTLTLGVAMEQRLWANLITALGRPEWSAAERPERQARTREMRAFLQGRVSALTSAELERCLDGVDTCWAIARAPGARVRVTGRLADSALATAEAEFEDVTRPA